MVKKGKQRLPVVRDTTDSSILFCLGGVNPFKKNEWKDPDKTRDLILNGRKLRAQEIANEIELDQSNVIRHLQYLSKANIGYVGIEQKKKAKYYYLKFDKILEDINKRVKEFIHSRMEDIKLLKNPDLTIEYEGDFSQFNVEFKNNLKKNKSYNEVVKYMFANYRLINLWREIELEGIYGEVIFNFGLYFNEISHRINKEDFQEMLIFHKICNKLIVNPLGYYAFKSELIPRK